MKTKHSSGKTGPLKLVFILGVHAEIYTATNSE